MCFYYNRRGRRQKVTGFLQDFTKILQNHVKTSFSTTKKADPGWIGQKEGSIKQNLTGRPPEGREMAPHMAVSAARPVGLFARLLLNQ
jgi:hypothetical protein